MEWYQTPLWKWREDRNECGRCQEPIDFQMARAYRAENFLKVHAVKGRSFKSIEEIQEYVDALLSTAWFTKRFGTGWKVTASVKGAGWAYGGPRGHKCGGMRLPAGWAFEEWVVLHEMAHAVTPSAAGGRHGRYWARMYMELVRYRMGVRVGELLKQAFKAEGVKSSPKRPPSIISQKCAANRPLTINSAAPSNRQAELARMDENDLKNFHLRGAILRAKVKSQKWAASQ